MGIVTTLRAKLDIYRLEQRYTKGRERRTRFTSNARYVDGQYIYEVNSMPTSSSAYSSSSPQPPSRIASLTGIGYSNSWQSPTSSPSTPRQTPREPSTPRFGTTTSIAGPSTPSTSSSTPSASPSSRFQRADRFTAASDGSVGHIDPPFSGDAESAWSRLPEQKQRQGFLKRGMSWVS